MKIAVLPGDGIGPEIMREAVKVLRTLGDLKFDLQEAPVGGTAYDQTGDPLPAGTLELAKSADAVLFGAVGDWKYDKLPREKRPEQAILGLRRELQPTQVHGQPLDRRRNVQHVERRGDVDQHVLRRARAPARSVPNR